jgi:hypothetical protein
MSPGFCTGFSDLSLEVLPTIPDKVWWGRKSRFQTKTDLVAPCKKQHHPTMATKQRGKNTGLLGCNSMVSSLASCLSLRRPNMITITTCSSSEIAYGISPLTSIEKLFFPAGPLVTLLPLGCYAQNLPIHPVLILRPWYNSDVAEVYR